MIIYSNDDNYSFLNTVINATDKAVFLKER